LSVEIILQSNFGECFENAGGKADSTQAYQVLLGVQSKEAKGMIMT
jgi:hypothetical protein